MGRGLGQVQPPYDSSQQIAPSSWWSTAGCRGLALDFFLAAACLLLLGSNAGLAGCFCRCDIPISGWVGWLLGAGRTGQWPCCALSSPCWSRSGLPTPTKGQAKHAQARLRYVWLQGAPLPSLSPIPFCSSPAFLILLLLHPIPTPVSSFLSSLSVRSAL